MNSEVNILNHENEDLDNNNKLITTVELNNNYPPNEAVNNNKKTDYNIINNKINSTKKLPDQFTSKLSSRSVNTPEISENKNFNQNDIKFKVKSIVSQQQIKSDKFSDFSKGFITLNRSDNNDYLTSTFSNSELVEKLNSLIERQRLLFEKVFETMQ